MSPFPRLAKKLDVSTSHIRSGNAIRAPTHPDITYTIAQNCVSYSSTEKGATNGVGEVLNGMAIDP